MLSPTTPPSRPVLKAVVALVVAGLVAWAAYARLTDDPAPAAAPPPAPPSAAARPVSIGPPPWVRYPNPLEGRWTADSGRLTLVVSNDRLTLTDITHYRSQRFITVLGHRVLVRQSGSDAELASYQWRIAGDRLTFRLLQRTPDATMRLEALRFLRVS